jgi:hypothetical protein
VDDPGAVVVTCPPLRATLRLRACLRRHVAVWASGAARGSPYFPLCARCPLGAARLEAAAPVPTLPPEVLPNGQRLARDAWRRTFPAHREPGDERLDPMREAAMGCPEDGGISLDVG